MATVTGKRLQRFDFATISGKPQRTQQGFLDIAAFVTRVGVLLYRDDSAEGGFRRELRHPDDVFAPKSLRSLGLAPVTDMHPVEGLVDPKNVGTLRMGVVAQNVVKSDDSRFVHASVIIEDAALIKKVEDGERRELSPGYTARVDEESGEWNGEHYDFRQREIEYNHLAVGPRGWGRSGSDVQLHMDSGLVSLEGDESRENIHIGNKPAPSRAVGSFVRAKLDNMDMCTAHLAAELGVDRWAVDSVLDGSWSAIDDNKQHLADPEGSGTRNPDTGLAKLTHFDAIAAFIDVPVETLFELVPKAERGDGRTQKPTRQQRNDAMEELELAGVKFKVDSALAGAVKNAITKTHADHADVQTKFDAKETELTAQKAALTTQKAETAKESARADAAVAETKKVQLVLDEAGSPDRIRDMVKARLGLVASATKVIVVADGEDAPKFDEMSDQDVKIAVILHSDSDGDKDAMIAKGDIYIDARFDSAVAHADSETVRTDANDVVARLAAASRRGSGGEPDAEQARADSLKDATENPVWQQGTKDAQA